VALIRGSPRTFHAGLLKQLVAKAFKNACELIKPQPEIAVLAFSLRWAGVPGARLRHFREAVMTNRIKAPCADCGMDTLRGDNWYMVQNHIWQSVWPESKTANAALGSGDDQIIPFSEILCLTVLSWTF
jgi:hypothetical protein